MEVGIPFYTPSDEHIAEYSHIGALIVDGLQIYEKHGCTTEATYIKVYCPVDSLVVRNAHVVRKIADATRVSLIETTEHAHIGLLHISGLTSDGLATLVDHRAGVIDTLCLNDILCANIEEPLVVGECKAGCLERKCHMWGRGRVKGLSVSVIPW